MKFVNKLALIPCLALVACIEDPGLDRISSSESATLAGENSSQPVFDVDTSLLERDATASDASVDIFPQRIALYGDLHVHTENSFDAYTFGSLATPADAYRYARGEAIPHPAGFDIQLARPLDFYAVTDHAMLMGVARAAADTSTDISRLALSEPMHNLNEPDNLGLLTLVGRSQLFGNFVPAMASLLRDGGYSREAVLDVTRSSWAGNVRATDEAYLPGEFTTFAAYEYTTSTDTRGNLHRNVIFRDTSRLPAVPFSRLHSQNPEQLWDWMDELRDMGIDSLAIPHNSNGSNGAMFKQVDWSGQAMDERYVEQRIRNEPLVELTQIKGTSETHPLLSDTDEWAGFELMEVRIGSTLESAASGSYAREALRMGLGMDAAGVGNPYQFGFIGSTDTHVGGGALTEDKFFSKAGLMDGLPYRRGSVPVNWFLGQLIKWTSEDLATEVDGRTYMASNVFERWGASGLAAVWAESNTRESVYSALRRKEAFATSGPRIRVRFFAGLDYPQGLIDSPDLLTAAYAGGVPMGGEIVGHEAAAPSFLVWAMADEVSAPLQRLQIIKGWEEQGKTFEQVYDDACSDGASVDPATWRCPDNGAKVSAEDCSISSDVGASELKVQWQDPQFDAAQSAFYYVRVLENPSCRWSTWDALRAGVEPRSDLQRTIQERAWSSPIWYAPAVGGE